VESLTLRRIGAALIGGLLLLIHVGSAPAAEAIRKPHALSLRKAGGRTLSFPSDVAIDRRGVVFLLDSGNRSIAIYSPKGEFIREIQGRGIWKDPLGVGVTSDGNILIADGEGGRVFEIDLAGRLKKEYVAGKGARLTGVCAYGDSIYVVDNRNHRIVMFKRKGGGQESWGRKGDHAGEFDTPFRIAADASGRIFVTDVMNARIQWFSAFGQYLGTLKRFGAGAGRIFRPTGLAIDNRGRIWVGDSYTGLVQAFDEKGNFAQAVSADSRPSIFGDPSGLADGAEGIWIADQRDGVLALSRQ
jgi:DNA-binding beta-propeller fold protein YncE